MKEKTTDHEKERQARYIKKYHSKFLFVNIRLTEEEHHMLKKLAQDADLSMSEYLREIIRQNFKSS